MFSSTKLESALDIKLAVSSKMENAISLWTRMFQDNPPWASDVTEDATLCLPNSIASEVARLVTVEMVSKVTGSPRADYINSQYKSVIEKARIYTEFACGMGGIVLKPYISGEKIPVAVVYAEDFYPTTFDSDGDITGACFLDYAYDDRYRYTRVEEHGYEDNGMYFIRNKCFRQPIIDLSTGSENLGQEVPLASVPEWAEVAEYITLGHIEKPLFSYFKMPFANNVEPKSPLGVSVFARAVKLIKKADKLWSEIMWEYEGGELAINVSSNLFARDLSGMPIVPEGRERLFKNIFDFDDENFVNTFNPAFRDSSLFNGLNRTLQRIEFQCGLAYGTLSDPANVERTATEINASRQRSYSTIHDTQNSLEKALRNLITAMDALTTLYGLAPEGKYEVTFAWDDSIIVDAEAERIRDREEVSQGLMLPWEYRVKWYGEDEATAKAKLDEQPEMDENEILGFGSEPKGGDGSGQKEE